MESFRSDDGLQIAYRTWGDDDGVPVLLHHGFGASAELDWVGTGVVGALTAAGRRVVALDARGHGASEKPHDAARYGEPRMAQDVVGLVDALGVPAVDLVGYSMGGVVSLLTAAREPRVRRLVVGGIGAGAVEGGGVDTRVLDPDALREALLADDPAGIAHPVAAAFRGFADSTGADRRALAAQASAVHRAPIPFGRITAPTLVLAGRDDPLAPRPEVLTAALPDATLTLVDGDHGSALHDAAFRRAVVAFLAA
ncbi:alpha/beta fold hydrolase [Actinotalea solisilvae]|uniref:alpha/beta fold hydrolase n=1 Tax=Actinotalea solisilvae TaxID=2072922 RepID=UPI0027DD7F75|nr:alpha/beta hydrolase [Actinotalea solisilvae]